MNSLVFWFILAILCFKINIFEISQHNDGDTKIGIDTIGHCLFEILFVFGKCVHIQCFGLQIETQFWKRWKNKTTFEKRHKLNGKYTAETHWWLIWHFRFHVQFSFAVVVVVACIVCIFVISSGCIKSVSSKCFYTVDKISHACNVIGAKNTNKFATNKLTEWMEKVSMKSRQVNFFFNRACAFFVFVFCPYFYWLVVWRKNFMLLLIFHTQNWTVHFLWARVGRAGGGSHTSTLLHGKKFYSVYCLHLFVELIWEH